MSQENVQLVRRLLEPFEAGDIAAFFRDEAGWAARLPAAEAFYAPDFEASFVRADVGRARYVGLDGLRAAWLDWLAPWVSYRTEIEDLIDAGEGRVVVLTHDYARPEGVGAEGIAPPGWRPLDWMSRRCRPRTWRRCGRSSRRRVAATWTH
jgi:ketosteroid isomerase-like protein